MLDALAARLGMDPIALRLKNVTEVSQTRNDNPKYTSTGFADCLKNGAATFGWAEARARKPLPSHIRRGVGVAGGMWQGGGGSPPATAIVKLFADGSANLNMGASDIGCGTKTWGAQIVAEELGVPMDRSSVEHADTGTTQFATPSGGSKTVPTESPAIRSAALDVKQQLFAMAAEQLKLPAADLELRGAEVVSKTDATKHLFDHLVESHAWQGPDARKFTYWSHLVAMLFGQSSSRKSLRDIVFSINRQGQKLYHLGLSEVKRSTLSDANKLRPAIIFEKTYYKLYERLSAELEPQPKKAPPIKIIDATTIDLCASVFPWAKFRTRKRAIKLHTVLSGLLP